MPCVPFALFLAALCSLVSQEDPVALKSWEQATEQAAQAPAAQAPPADRPKAPPPQQPPTGQPAPVQDRDSLKDEQQPAPRPGNESLDPKFANYLQIPSTPVLIKFNAKPRVDMTVDNRNSGNDTRFVTEQIPVSTDPEFGGGRRFNINSKGSQLSVDVRAPDVDGAPRFYYQNDFFGSGPGEFPFRVRQLYGEVYNIIAGMTFSVFEDPDVWPDTVDYEGPNSAIFARRPLVRYMLPLNNEWQLNFGIEQPSSDIDTSIDPAASPVNRAPDLGVNARWEDTDVGHVQLAVIGRRLGVRGPITGDQSTYGWGLNLSGVINTFGKDSMQLQVTYGEGVFHFSNDNFVNADAAFDNDGRLVAIPYFAAMFGYTHHWTDVWRSTVTYGYVHLRNQALQEPTAYHFTNYTSLNLVWQIRKRLSLGVEGLYGSKEDKAENRGDVYRIQFGVLYALLD
jgi:hypothetical protein